MDMDMSDDEKNYTSHGKICHVLLCMVLFLGEIVQDSVTWLKCSKSNGTPLSLLGSEIISYTVFFIHLFAKFLLRL